MDFSVVSFFFFFVLFYVCAYHLSMATVVNQREVIQQRLKSLSSLVRVIPLPETIGSSAYQIEELGDLALRDLLSIFPDWYMFSSPSVILLQIPRHPPRRNRFNCHISAKIVALIIFVVCASVFISLWITRL